MADIDHLQKVNEKYGYHAGDEMVINVARLFANSFRNEDIITRYGGDEFAVLLPNTGEDVVQIILSRIEKQTQEFNAENKDHPIEITIGYATANRGDSLKESLKLASLMIQ